MSTAEDIVAQPTALEIARERLGRAQDPRNITMLDTQQTDALVAIAAALIALAEQANVLTTIADGMAVVLEREP